MKYLAGLVVLTVLVVFAISIGLTLANAVVDRPPTVRRVVSGGPPDVQAALVPANPAGPTAAQVRGWCISEHCAMHGFEELMEGNRRIVHMTTGPAVTFAVPDGFWAHVWDCSQTSIAGGPASFTACEATFRVD